MRFTILLLMLCCLFTQSQRNQSKRGNKPPIVEKIEATPSSLTFCPPHNGEMFCSKASRTTVTLAVSARDPEGGSLNYKWSAAVGEILGEGSEVTWNLKDQRFGSHEAKVTVTDSDGDETTATIKVPVELCTSCVIPDPPCPIVVVKSYVDVAHRAEKIIFYTETSPGYFKTRPDYLWTIEGGKVLEGQHTPQVKVEVTGKISSDVIATVQVEGFAPECNTSARESVPIRR